MGRGFDMPEWGWGSSPGGADGFCWSYLPPWLWDDEDTPEVESEGTEGRPLGAGNKELMGEGPDEEEEEDTSALFVAAPHTPDALSKPCCSELSATPPQGAGVESDIESSLLELTKFPKDPNWKADDSMGASHFPILRNALGADSCTISCTCAVISLSLETSGMDTGVGAGCATGATMGSTRTSSFTSSTATTSFIVRSATCSRAAESSSTVITSATSSSSSCSSACTSTTSTGVFGYQRERKTTIKISN
jgi:hypothetical protein